MTPGSHVVICPFPPSPQTLISFNNFQLGETNALHELGAAHTIGPNQLILLNFQTVNTSSRGENAFPDEIYEKPTMNGFPPRCQFDKFELFPVWGNLCSSSLSASLNINGIPLLEQNGNTLNKNHENHKWNVGLVSEICSLGQICEVLKESTFYC